MRIPQGRFENLTKRQYNFADLKRLRKLQKHVNNVGSVKKETKLRSNTLLDLVSFFTEQTLQYCIKFSDKNLS